ncbi:MAG: hypothetical protein IKP66_06615 [Lachnospiraceae bacterium]|nr:hypothetical protein [Lachnospiraceae bacterium]
MEFEENELFIYVNGDSYEIGKVKSKRDDNNYYCYYHRGYTAALTPIECMHKLVNAYVIKSECLGDNNEI